MLRYPFAGDQRTGFLNGHAVARYSCDDKVAERVLLTQLAEVVPYPTARSLRFRSVEDWKNGLRRDLGVLIGESAAPSVLTMRTKLKAVAESLDPVAFSRDMLQRYVALEPVWEGLYYVDGHFCPYYGSQPSPKGWDAKRRLAAKGHTDVYLHDAKGRVLFFFSQPLNDSLAHAIPGAVAEIHCDNCKRLLPRPLSP